MKLNKILLGTLLCFLSNFFIQGILTYLVAGEYFLSIEILRMPPLIKASILQAIISSFAFSTLYPMTWFEGNSVIKGLKYGVFIGLIVVPFIAIDLPARFMIPDANKWMIIQGSLGFLHFTVAGVLISLLYKNN